MPTSSPNAAATGTTAVRNVSMSASTRSGQLRRKKLHPRMKRCQPSHNHTPKRTIRPARGSMNARIIDDIVGHGGTEREPYPLPGKDRREQHEPADDGHDLHLFSSGLSHCRG